MKKVALLLLFALVGCEASPVTSPEIPTATLSRSASCSVKPFHRIDGALEPLHGSGARPVWDYTIKFYTSCDSDVNAKVYFIHPVATGDGRRAPVADVDAAVFLTDELGVLRFASFRLIVPKERATYPDGWNPKFFVEVRSGGVLIGSFFTVDDGTPDLRFAD